MVDELDDVGAGVVAEVVGLGAVVVVEVDVGVLEVDVLGVVLVGVVVVGVVECCLRFGLCGVLLGAGGFCVTTP